MKKLIRLTVCFVLFAFTFSLANAQTYQTKVDTMWGNWCYKFKAGDFYSRVETKSTLSNFTPATTDMTLVYYLRVPATGAKANLVYTPKYARMPKITLTVTRVSTGDTLCVQTIQNTTLSKTGKEITDEILPYTTFPQDEYYRFELYCDNWSYLTNIKYFLFNRTATLPILQHPQGGYGQHLFTWASTIPSAPTGQVYDWAYQEVLVPKAYQHPADYYCTIATLQCYMGIQSLERVGDGFKRTVLFSCWDTGNTDENPDLPQYLRAKVYDYNHRGVSGHGGGEGSSGTIQLRNETYWWKSDEWVQFLVNARPESADEVETTKDGVDEVHSVENTLLSVWYKNSSDSAWTYLATIREATKNEMIGSWYSFLENFGGAEGHAPHKVYYRHGYMRSAASGKWYNRNNISFRHYDDRTTRTDRYSGSTRLYENAFQMVYGGWGLATDSSNVAGLPENDLAVDTINLDPLNARIDTAAHVWRNFSLLAELNKNSHEYAHSAWQVVSSTGSNASSLLNEDKYTYWESNQAEGHSIIFKSKNGEVPITSFRLHFPDGYSGRTRYVDVYTSNDGNTWTLGAQNVFINNEDDNDVTLPQTLSGEYFKIFFHEQIDCYTKRLRISTLAFRGNYELEKIKLVAKDIIDHENALQYYKTEDIAALKEVYANGTCTDENALSAEIKKLYGNCMPLMYGRAAATNQITISKAYMMQNVDGLGYLCGSKTDGLCVKGATADNAKDYARTSASATDPVNTWQIIRSEAFETNYVYNIGLGKYLNPEVEGWLSDTPYPFVATISVKGICLRSAKQGSAYNGKYLTIDTSLDNPFSFATLSNKARFLLLEDYYLRPENAKALEIANKTFLNERLEAAKAKAQSLLAVPKGRIGSIANDETKAYIETLYNGGDVAAENAERFIEAVETVQLLKMDTGHAYAFTSTTEASIPTLQMTSTGLAGAASSVEPSKIWTLRNNYDGKVLTSQGKGLRPQPTTTTGYTTTGTIGTASYDKSVYYYLSPTSKAGEFLLADNSYPRYSVGFDGTNIKSVVTTNAKWNVDVVNEYTIKTNSVGVASLYVDFDLIVPTGVQVYVANRITPDGVIKLSYLTDTIPALTPILIKADPYTSITFGVRGHELQPYNNSNRFSGTLFKNSTLKKNTYYTLKSANGKPVMKKAKIAVAVGDNDIYLNMTDAMPDLDTYTFDFDDLIDDVKAVPASETSATQHVAYDLQGRSTSPDAHGLLIIDGKKVSK